MPTISKSSVELNNVVNPMADGSVVGANIGGGNVDEESGFKESLYHVKSDVANAILDPRLAMKNALKKEVPMGVNSKHRTVFLMLNTMIGSGILNQPQVFSKSGIFGAIALFAICGYFIWLGCVIIIDVGLRWKVDSFQELMEKKFGKGGKVFLDLLIIVGNIGALMSYLTIIGGTLTSLICSWGGDGPGDDVYLITVLVTTFLVLPLCLTRHFGHLGVVSYISIGAISIVLLVVVIAGPIFGNGGRIVVMNGTGMFAKLGSIVFALSCIPASFHAYSGVKDTSLSVWKGIMFDSVLYGITMCVVMGLAGYLSFRGDTNGMILDNFTTHFGDPFDLMLVLHLILYMPVEFTIVRYSIVKLIQLHDEEEKPLRAFWHALLTCVLLYACMVFELLLHATGLSNGDAFGVILDFTGGVVFSIVSFILPALLYLLDDSDTSSKEYTIPCYCMLVFGCFTFVAVPVASILSLTN